MTSRPRWVRCSPTKVPLTVTGDAASSTDPATWSTYTKARRSTAGVGLGFVLGDGIGCIDLDDCLIDGEPVPWARDILVSNPDTFVEVSRSGRGLHIFGLLPEQPGRRIRDGRSIEVYSTSRYIAVTGNRHGTAPVTLAPLVVP